MEKKIALDEMNQIDNLKNNMTQLECINKNLRVLYYMYYEKSKTSAKNLAIDLILKYIKSNKIKIDLNDFITLIENEIEDLSKTYELYLISIFKNIRISTSNQYINVTKIVGYHEKSLIDANYNKYVIACAQKTLDYSVVDIESRKRIFSICDDLYESIINIFKIEEMDLDIYKISFSKSIINKFKNIFRTQKSKIEFLNQKLEKFKQGSQQKIEQLEDEIDTYNAQMEIVIDQINTIYANQIEI